MSTIAKKGVDALNENGVKSRVDNSKNINSTLGGTSSVYRIGRLIILKISICI